MSNSIIRAELESKLKAWSDSQSIKVPISFENVPFTKPTTGTFLECMLIPNISFNRNVAGTGVRSLGIFQINCWGKEGVGMGKVESLANTIISLYPLVPKSGLVSIEATPYSESSISDPTGWVIIPVTVKYRYEN